MKTKNQRWNPIFTAAVILLGLVMISTHFTAGLFARYTARASGDASARVAVFAVDTELDRISLGTNGAPAFQLGGTEAVQAVSLPFYVTSGSEVAVGYSVTVDFGGVALPDYMSLTLTDGVRTQTLGADGRKAAFTFADFGGLDAAAGEVQRADLELVMAVSDLGAIEEEITIPAATLTVRVYQVD